MISSIFDQTIPPTETILVDCQSTDNSISFVQKKYPSIKILPVPNLGYGQGCNRGAQVAQGQFLVFLNPDIYLPQTFIESLTRYYQSQSKTAHPIGVVGCQTCDFDVPIPSRPHFTFSTVDFFGNPTDSTTPNQSHQTFIAGGIPFFISKSVFHQTGGFNPAIFLYGEEVDYSWRLKLLGYHNLICQNTWLHHYGSGIIGQTSPTKIANQIYGCFIACFTNYSSLFLVIIFPFYFFYLSLIFLSLPFLTKFNLKYNQEFLARFHHFFSNFSSISTFRRQIQSHRLKSDFSLFKYFSLLPSVLIRKSYQRFST